MDLHVRAWKVKAIELNLRMDRADGVLPLLKEELECFACFYGKELEFDCEPRLV